MPDQIIESDILPIMQFLSFLEIIFSHIVNLDSKWLEFSFSMPGKVSYLCGRVFKNCAQGGLPRFIALYFITILRYCGFYKLNVLATCMEPVYQCHFPNSISSLCVTVLEFGNSHSASNFFFYYCYVCHGDQWSFTTAKGFCLAEGWDYG